MKIIIIFFFLVISFNSVSGEIGNVTGLKIPRYVSTKSDDSNIRIGPSTNYPIVLKYINQNYPLQIIEEHKDWRKIRDFQNNKGWIHKSLITGNRNGIIVNISQEPTKLYNIDNGNSIGEIYNGAIVNLKKCKINWCFISFNNYKGWVKKKSIWGVENNEAFNVGYIQIVYNTYWQSINKIKNYLDKHYD